MHAVHEIIICILLTENEITSYLLKEKLEDKGNKSLLAVQSKIYILHRYLISCFHFHIFSFGM